MSDTINRLCESIAKCAVAQASANVYASMGQLAARIDQQREEAERLQRLFMQLCQEAESAATR